MRFELRLTEKCNQNCSYCNMHSNKEDSLFDFDGFDCFLKNNQLNEQNELFIYGGEPTLHKDIRKIILKYSSFFSKIIVQTNGTNLEVLENLPVNISLSYHKEYDNVIDFIKKIKKYNITNINYMDSNDNYEDYNLLKKLVNPKKTVVQFCPLLEKDFINTTQSLKDLKNKPIFKKLQNDYHFKKINGYSNYDYWLNNLNTFKNQDCYIKYHLIHMSNNKIYNCFNDLRIDKGGIPFSDYIHIKKKITCCHDICHFEMHLRNKNENDTES